MTMNDDERMDPSGFLFCPECGFGAWTIFAVDDKHIRIICNRCYYMKDLKVYQ